jgi:hypothetical protein
MQLIYKSLPMCFSFIMLSLLVVKSESRLINHKQIKYVSYFFMDLFYWIASCNMLRFSFTNSPQWCVQNFPFQVHYGISSATSVKIRVFWILDEVTKWTKIIFSSFVVLISPLCLYSLQKKVLTFVRTLYS